MFIDSLENLPNLVARSGCSILVAPESSKITLPNAILVGPDETKKTPTITIDQIREIMPLLLTKQQNDRFIIIRPADALTEGAENALLKSLEEPRIHYHFLLVTENPTQLLPTILSRSAIFYLKNRTAWLELSSSSKKTRDLARRLISAPSRNLPVLADEITMKKDVARATALEVLTISIEMLWKGYFKTKNPAFLEKIPKFVTAFDNISKNGHVKLHLVADLL